MERLDELSLGIRGKKMGEGKDCPPAASPAAVDYMASTLDVPQTLFDVPCQTLVHLGSAIRREEDPSLSESISRDLLLGVPLCSVPSSALR